MGLNLHPNPVDCCARWMGPWRRPSFEMTHQTSFSFIQPFIDFSSYHNTPEIHTPAEQRRHCRPPPAQHSAGPAGVLDGLMSICLSVPAVQVGGYSAQQVEIGRHTATPPASRCRASVALASLRPRKVAFIKKKTPTLLFTGISQASASERAAYCGCVLAFSFVSKCLSSPLFLLSPPLSTGSIGICLCKFGTAPILTKCSLSDTQNTRHTQTPPGPAGIGSPFDTLLW